MPQTWGNLITVNSNLDHEGHMTKAELVEKIAKDAVIPEPTAKIAFDSTLDGIKNGLKKRTARSLWWDSGRLRMSIQKPHHNVVVKSKRTQP
jgi:nucleoid DNA-binding protein